MRERERKGTGGALTDLPRDFRDKHLVVLAADMVNTVDLEALVAEHLESRADVSPWRARRRPAATTTPPRVVPLAFVTGRRPTRRLGSRVPVPILLGVGAAAGAVAAIWEVMWVTAVQTHVEHRFLGRVWALDEFGSAIATPLAFAAVGLAVTALDATTLTWTAAALATIVTIVAASFPAVRMAGRHLNRQDPMDDEGSVPVS